uniref:Uncharacterized protein n=1 Tax=Vespula pensylvanica TaxID=30213 RepID=A0A834KPN1_VESPE|nr:hypothetical protein H0235_013268 [Vespula pensylvanica]
MVDFISYPEISYLYDELLMVLLAVSQASSSQALCFCPSFRAGQTHGFGKYIAPSSAGFAGYGGERVLVRRNAPVVDCSFLKIRGIKHETATRSFPTTKNYTPADREATGVPGRKRIEGEKRGKGGGRRRRRRTLGPSESERSGIARCSSRASFAR